MKDLIAKLKMDANCAMGAIWMHIDAQAARIAELEAQIAASADTDKLREAISKIPTPFYSNIVDRYEFGFGAGLKAASDLIASTALQAPVREVLERNAVIVVKPWQERCSGFAKRYMTELAQKAIEDEITELRAALAERNQP